MRLALLLMLIGVCLAATPARADESKEQGDSLYRAATAVVLKRALESTFEPLRGLDTVKVLPINNGETGLSKDSLKTLVELRLRSHGLKVVDDDGKPGPVLMISVGAWSPAEAQSTLEYRVDLQLTETVLLTRDLSKSALAFTWSEFDMGECRLDQIDRVKNTTVELVDKFINEWMKANGR